MTPLSRPGKPMSRLQEALDRAGNTHTPEDVFASVAAGKAQLWRKNGSLIVTEIFEYPRAKALNFWLAAGDLPDLLELAPTCYTWGRSQGCDRAYGTGRDAWSRALAKDGWKKLGSVLVRTLSDG